MCRRVGPKSPRVWSHEKLEYRRPVRQMVVARSPRACSQPFPQVSNIDSSADHSDGVALSSQVCFTLIHDVA